MSNNPVALLRTPTQFTRLNKSITYGFLCYYLTESNPLKSNRPNAFVHVLYFYYAIFHSVLGLMWYAICMLLQPVSSGPCKFTVSDMVN